MWNKFFCQRVIDKDYKINKNFNLLLYKIRGKNYPRYCFVMTPEVKKKSIQGNSFLYKNK